MQYKYFTDILLNKYVFYYVSLSIDVVFFTDRITYDIVRFIEHATFVYLRSVIDFLSVLII